MVEHNSIFNINIDTFTATMNKLIVSISNEKFINETQRKMKEF
jgi:hypothetical protein